MLISTKWLNDYVSLSDLSPNQIAETLTDLGLEVESITNTPPLDENIVVGKVLTARKHPNADTLTLCTVDVGASEPLSIVCGAHNAREGIIVAVATKGTVLPDGTKIKASKIRGEPSEGMLCSEQELGLSSDAKGIIELGSSFKVSEKINSHFKTQDSIFDIKLTPNRSDCLSYIGIARDLSAKLGRPLKLPDTTVSSDKAQDRVTVIVENPHDCGRFAAKIVTGIKPVTSPSWLKKRLDASGMKSINLIVDITNYVMLEYGQPVHAYDRRLIEGDTLKVSSPDKVSSLTILDGTKIEVLPGDIVIGDTKKIVGLAGIMGGQNSGIKDDTEEIIIEVAHFSPQKIRKTAKRLAMSSEASYRFERGTDIERIPEVLNRVCSLLFKVLTEQKVDSAQISTHTNDCYPSPILKKKIALRLSRIRSFLSNPILSLDTCVQYLTRLGFSLADKTEERMLFEIPSWRTDVLREIDLIEEVARLHSYDNIPYELPRIRASVEREDPYLDFQGAIKQSLASLGLTEVMTYPFLGLDNFTKLGLEESHGLWPKIKLANALNDKAAFMQTTLLPGLLEALHHNRNHGQKGVRLFEVGRSFLDPQRSSWGFGKEYWTNFLRPSRNLSHKWREDKGRPVERELLGGIVDQPFHAKEWQHSETQATFYHCKEIVCSLLKMFGLAPFFEKCEEGWFPFLHPSASAWVLSNGQKIGWVGELHPKTSFAYELGETSPVYFELDLEACFNFSKKSPNIQQSFRFPPVTRDIAFVLPKELSYENFDQTIRHFRGRKNLNGFQLFDVYEGPQVGEGKKSFAASFTFQSNHRTLNDEEVDQEVGMLIQFVNEKLGATQR